MGQQSKGVVASDSYLSHYLNVSIYSLTITIASIWYTPNMAVPNSNLMLHVANITHWHLFISCCFAKQCRQCSVGKTIILLVKKWLVTSSDPRDYMDQWLHILIVPVATNVSDRFIEMKYSTGTQLKLKYRLQNTSHFVSASKCCLQYLSSKGSSNIAIHLSVTHPYF